MRRQERSLPGNAFNQNHPRKIPRLFGHDHFQEEFIWTNWEDDVDEQRNEWRQGEVEPTDPVDEHLGQSTAERTLLNSKDSAVLPFNWQPKEAHEGRFERWNWLEPRTPKPSNLEFDLKEMPEKVKKTSEIDQIEKSYIPIKEVISRMSNNHILQENFYFFCHEINKILFLMDVSRNLLNYLSKSN